MQTYSLLDTVLLSFQTYTVTKNKCRHQESKDNGAFPQLAIFLDSLSQKKRAIFSANTHQDMHGWGWNMRTRGRRRKMFKKTQKGKGACPQCVIAPPIHFQCLITICSSWCPYWAQLLFLCHWLTFLWESKRHQALPWKSSEAERDPRCLLSGLVCNPVGLFMLCIQVIHFVPTLLCFEHDLRALGCFHPWAVCCACNRTIVI